MKRFHVHMPQIISYRRWMTSLAALAGACLAILPQGLYAHGFTPPPVPTSLEVPEGNRPFLRGIRHWHPELNTRLPNKAGLRLFLGLSRAAGHLVHRL